MKSEIMDELLADTTRQEIERYLSFIDAYGGKDGDEEVRRLILRLYDFQMSLMILKKVAARSDDGL